MRPSTICGTRWIEIQVTSTHAVVMARLLVLRDRVAEAEAMLAEFLGRCPDDATARESLDQLRAGTYLDITVAAFDDAQDFEIQEGSDHGGPLMPPPGALQELLRRGNLAGEFSRARIAMDRGLPAPTDLIRQESMKGDPLAGFYSQWLMLQEIPEGPSARLGVEGLPVLARVLAGAGQPRSLAASGVAIPRSRPGDGVPSRAGHTGRRRSIRCNRLAQTLLLRE